MISTIFLFLSSVLVLAMVLGVTRVGFEDSGRLALWIGAASAGLDIASAYLRFSGWSGDAETLVITVMALGSALRISMRIVALLAANVLLWSLLRLRSERQSAIPAWVGVLGSGATALAIFLISTPLAAPGALQSSVGIERVGLFRLLVTASPLLVIALPTFAFAMALIFVLRRRLRARTKAVMIRCLVLLAALSATIAAVQGYRAAFEFHPPQEGALALGLALGFGVLEVGSAAALASIPVLWLITSGLPPIAPSLNSDPRRVGAFETATR